MPDGAERAKIILAGKVEKKFTVSGIGASKGAKAAIEKAGGSVAAWSSPKRRRSSPRRRSPRRPK